jgi:hypothetical protein
MTSSNLELRLRVETLERQIKTRRQYGSVALVLAALLVGSLGLRAQDGNRLRVRSLVIEDEQGRARIVLGAPLPDDGRNTNLRSGMRINDPNGVERLGLNLFEDGAS